MCSHFAFSLLVAEVTIENIKIQKRVQKNNPNTCVPLYILSRSIKGYCLHVLLFSFSDAIYNIIILMSFSTKLMLGYCIQIVRSGNFCFWLNGFHIRARLYFISVQSAIWCVWYVVFLFVFLSDMQCALFIDPLVNLNNTFLSFISTPFFYLVNSNTNVWETQNKWVANILLGRGNAQTLKKAFLES